MTPPRYPHSTASAPSGAPKDPTAPNTPPAPTGADGPEPDTAAHKRCGGCGRVLGLGEFGFKDRERGKYQSRCKDCMRAYGATWHQANAQARRAALGQRRDTALAELTTAVTVALRSAGCARCAGTSKLTVPIDHPDARGRRLSQLMRAGWAAGKLMPLVEQAIADGLVRCAGCASGDYHAAAATTRTEPDGTTSKVCTMCQTRYPLDRFSWRQEGVRRQARCKDCAAKASAQSTLNAAETRFHDPDRPRAAVVRAWAREQGQQVPVRGPLPAALVDAYVAAHPAPTGQS